ncbi:MAG: repair protein RadC [Halanaerobiales bacterium]|nr:repair protein RadC [Halanaerobiales bacterium]
MFNVYCWRCGTKISEKDVLGLGHFDQQIGKYKGKGFIAFNCPQCKKARYQVLDADFAMIQNQLDKGYNKSPADVIDLDQVIDFHKVLNKIDTVEGFLERCEMASDTISTEIKKPILQPLDVYNLFRNHNSSNLKRLMILTLDKDNFPVNWEFLGEGASRPVSFEPKTIFRTALLMEEKAAVIIAQNLDNHFTQPTQKDILMTKRLINAGKVLGVDFLDHIVIKDNGFHSYDQLNYI